MSTDNTPPFLAPDFVTRRPQRCTTPTTWLGHIPFAFWLVNQARPRVIVELGVHTGNSYCAFCEEVVRSALPTTCFGVDTWAGDDHAGHYGDDVLAELRSHHDPKYQSFSTLLRSDFNTAVHQFADGSIDLLHIDGFHSYDAVRGDFETWQPKLSDRAIVLFHDTSVRANEFGVWQFWRELTRHYPGFTFQHSFGLGVLAAGKTIPAGLEALFAAGRVEAAEVRETFSALGDSLVSRIEPENTITKPRATSKAPEPRVAAEICPGETANAPMRGRHLLGRLRKSARYRLNALLGRLPDVATPVNVALVAPFFDAQWYGAKHPEAFAHVAGLLDYYARTGAAAGHDPSPLFSGSWYLKAYPDVADTGQDPFLHFVLHGAAEARQPHPLFDIKWYLSRNPDVATAGVNALRHYIENGAAEGRDPNPYFDTAYYVDEHPDAAENPLRHYILFGEDAGFSTHRTWKVEDYLASKMPLPAIPQSMSIDIIIPVYRGMTETLLCIETVLNDTERPSGNVIVVDDCSPDEDLSAALRQLQQQGSITLIRNEQNLGFVRSVNKAMVYSARRDIVLLNSDTEVPQGWLKRLAAHAYANKQIGTITPFSNNATICSYPPTASQYITGDRTLAEMDSACATANAGRSVDIPTAVGFCMYIKRACLDQVGLFNEVAFGRGYGEENDFCLRASAVGWKHVLACDVFVYHKGEVSFGAQSADRQRGIAALTAMYPDYLKKVQKFTMLDPVAAARFALSCTLFRNSDRPTLVMLQHDLGGGTDTHIGELVDTLYNLANIFVIKPESFGFTLSLPAIAGHPVLRFMETEIDAIVRILQSANVTRLHIHHTANLPSQLRRLVDLLNVPFDFTVHDYFTICPQITLLSNPDNSYCGEPGLAECDRCIARRPQYESKNIIEWRQKWSWVLEEADRVICPSFDVQSRITRYAPRARSIVVPHDANAVPRWFVNPTVLQPGEPLRIAVFGTVARHKGRERFLALAEQADPEQFEFITIGSFDPPLATRLANVQQTGPYGSGELRRWVFELKPHVVWFPGRWPETYSYTLSEAFEARLPVVAPGIGAFTERLAGRPWSWLMAIESTVDELLNCFAAVRQALLAGSSPHEAGPRKTEPDFYPATYLAPALAADIGQALHDLRRPGVISLMVIPERLEEDRVSACAYIRLIMPLDDLAAASNNISYQLVDTDYALKRVADVLLCSRYAINPEQTAAVLQHCRATGMRLIYDIDDDLLAIPIGHPEAARLQSLTPGVRALLDGADQVWVSTRPLKSRLAEIRADALVIENALDERMFEHPKPERNPGAPIRILYMGTETHDAELSFLAPVAQRLSETFGSGINFEVIGISSHVVLPPGFTRVMPPAIAHASYPGFINWLQTAGPWDIGVAPLLETEFNEVKSSIKLLDYAALKLPIIASNFGPYSNNRLDQVRLVGNIETEWYDALQELIRDEILRREMAVATHAAFLSTHTLAARRQERVQAISGLIS